MTHYDDLAKDPAMARHLRVQGSVLAVTEALAEAIEGADLEPVVVDTFRSMFDGRLRVEQAAAMADLCGYRLDVRLVPLDGEE